MWDLDEIRAGFVYHFLVDFIQVGEGMILSSVVYFVGRRWMYLLVSPHVCFGNIPFCFNIFLFAGFTYHKKHISSCFLYLLGCYFSVSLQSTYFLIKKNVWHNKHQLENTKKMKIV